MQKVVGVKFKPSSKVYIFSTNGLKLEVNDEVIVDSAMGLSYGIVASNEREVDESKLSDPLKDVVRLATPADKKKFKELSLKASRDIAVVKEKVDKLGLEMKIVSAEYTFDGNKIIIDFSAEERVDFRELLKELATSLKTRIELHQVGQRDEVKIKGGIGPCGEICCCTRFLKDFEHVTVKMAKNQGLSLSPTKISGLCGRLMCCLAYENSTYEESLKKMPKVNSELLTPKGKGTVVYNDLLRERVSVKIRNNDDSYTVYDFSLEELKGEKTQAPKLQEKSQKEKTQEKEVKDNHIEKEPASPAKVEQETSSQEAKPKNNYQNNKNKHKNRYRNHKKSDKKEGNNNGIPNNR